LGYGGVLVCQDTGRVWSFGGKWKRQPKKICEAELGAVVEAMERFSEILKEKKVLLVIDNTSVVGVLRKEQSFSVVLSSLLETYKSVLEKRGVVVVGVQWIASKLNPADPPSRGREACERASREQARERLK
jgi:hypothetical protein